MRLSPYLQHSIPYYALAVSIAIIAMAYHYSYSILAYAVTFCILHYIALLVPKLMYFPSITYLGRLRESVLLRMYGRTHASVRQEISVNFRGHQYYVNTNNGIASCIIIRGFVCSNNSHIAIICNSTESSYEYSYLFKEILQWPLAYFFRLQIDVLLWNYNEIGLSHNTYTLQNAREDSVYLANFVRQKLKYSTVTVYGFSIGADIACYMANHAKVDFLIADRAYGDLNYLSSVTANAFIAKLLSKCGWNGLPAKEYINCNCAKIIIGCTSSIFIPEIASLRCVVAQMLISNYNYRSNWCSLSIEKASALVNAIKQIVASNRKDGRKCITKLLLRLCELQIGCMKFMDCIYAKNCHEYLRVWLCIAKVYLNATKRVLVTELVELIESARIAIEKKKSAHIIGQLKIVVNSFSDVLVCLKLGDGLIEVSRMGKVIIINGDKQSDVNPGIQNEITKFMKANHIVPVNLVI